MAVSEETLLQRIEALEQTVARQAQLLQQTGQQLLALQLAGAKQDLDKIGPPAGAAVDTSDFVTNEDIVQLVGELQGQLDCVEERTKRRTLNLTAAAGTELVPMVGPDGEEPPAGVWPAGVTAAGWAQLGAAHVVRLGQFYDLLPANPREQAQIQQFLDGDVSEAELQRGLARLGVEGEPADYGALELEEFRAQLATYVGVREDHATA